MRRSSAGLFLETAPEEPALSTYITLYHKQLQLCANQVVMQYIKGERLIDIHYLHRYFYFLFFTIFHFFIINIYLLYLQFFFILVH